MTKILELFERDPNRRIEEVIKVDQTSSPVVRQEIEEYVPTESIRQNFIRVLEHFRETPNKPHEGIGIWISGFFGAGKSSFAKILGYILENRELNGTTASELFAQQTADPQIASLLRQIHEQIPTKSVIFDVSTDQAVTDADEMLSDIVYRVLLRELGYSTDREIAELEIELEGAGRLQEFKETFSRIFPGESWDDVKYLAATARNRASRVLHEMDPATYPNADSWAKTPAKVNVSAKFVAERARILIARRGGGRALVFVIDEVGQYVARSTRKMLDLQGLIQALGVEGYNHASKWKGQVWLVATSQERLSEVVDNLDGQLVELARLRDRFKIEVDLAPSDIREVTSVRVLKKKPAAAAELKKLFEEHRGKLTEATQVSGRLDTVPLNAETFAELYPFLPYQIDLIIQIVSGLRTQAGASRHVGGANRTIIKLAQQALIDERVGLGNEPIGRLVSLDILYDLLENLVASERQRDIQEIKEAFGADAMETRVAKALALLQFVPSVVRNVANIAALLHRRVDEGPQRDAVVQALHNLAAYSKVRETEQGWELLSQVGRSWEEERRGVTVYPRDRNALLEDAARELFDDVSGYRHKNLRTFNITPVVNGRRLGRQGDIDLFVNFVAEDDALEAVRGRARQESNTEGGQNSVYWVVPIPEELTRLLDDLHRSGWMISRYEREHTPDQSRLLSDEKTRQRALRASVVAKLRSVFAGGYQFFRGVETPLRNFGTNLDETVRGALRDAIPKLFPKFDLAAVQVRSAAEAVKILESDTLAGLPQVFYDGTDGLGLVRREAGTYAIDTQAPALEEVLSFIRSRQDFGEKPSGKQLESHFTGFGYGWDLEVVMLLTATLLRAGVIEVYHGRRYTSYGDPAVQDIFRKPQSFRAATFAQRESAVTLRHRAAVAEALERLYGDQVPLEEEALAAALRRLLPRDADRAYSVLSVLRARSIPGVGELQELHETLRGIVEERAAEDAILAFHNQREQITRALERLKKLEVAVTEANLATLQNARRAVDRLWPELQSLGVRSELAEEASSLRELLESDDFFEHLALIGQRTRTIAEAYGEERKALTAKVEEAVQHALDELRNQEIWQAIPELEQNSLLRPFHRIADAARGDTAPLSELSSNLFAIDGLYANALARMIEIAEALEGGDQEDAKPVVTRIRVGRFAPRGLRTEDEVDEVLSNLRNACLEAIARGDTVVLE